MPDLPLIIGIDLGTTNSVAAWVDVAGDGAPAILARPGGAALTPSVVAFEDGGGVIVGQRARELARANPERTVFSVKRLMGKAVSELPELVKLLPYTVVDYADKIAAIRLPGVEREVTPQELSAMILRDVRATAEAALGRKVEKAVVTVPAYFDDAQRQATRDAGRIAGLEVVRIVNEPTAAALAYGLDKKKKGTIAVFDLGGGTFDVSILKLTGGVFKVIATTGDTFLGGDDFDRKLVDAALADIERDWGVKLHRDPQALHGLRDAAETCKFALTDAEHAQLVFETTIDGASREYTRTFTRAEFDAMITPDVERAIACCKAALADAKLGTEKIDEVVLVGGSTRVPLVRRRVGEFFNRAPHTELNPDEVVALGAAVQAHILAGGRRDLTLLDVVPLSLGIEVYGGAMQKMITRNTTVPCQAQDMFSTFADEQTAFKLHVLQGERELARDCRSLGTFILRGIPKMPAGMPRLQVAFALDANGTLTVTAHELRSGQELEVQIEPAHGLSKDEVTALVEESIEHAMDDMSARFEIERRNRIDLLVRVTHKELARAREGAYYPADKLDAIEAAVREAETVLASGTAFQAVSPPQRDEQTSAPSESAGESSLADGGHGLEGHATSALDEIYEKLAALTVPLAEVLVEHTARAEFFNRAIDDPRFSALVADNLPVDETARRHVQVDE